MENLNCLSETELTEVNGGLLKAPIGLGGLLLIIDAAIAFYEGIEEAYYEKNPQN